MKATICKVCSSKYHTAYKCPDNPKAVAKAKATQERMAEKSRSKAISKPVRPVKSKGHTINRPKSKTRSQLVKELDRVFSIYIRVKDSVDGMAVCVTCSDRKEWKLQQNGHYMSRGHYPTRWDITNCHVQCAACNLFKKGNYTSYAIYMINRYGTDHLLYLDKKAKSGEKIPTPVIRDMIEEYKQKVLTYM